MDLQATMAKMPSMGFHVHKNFTAVNSTWVLAIGYMDYVFLLQNFILNLCLFDKDKNGSTYLAV